MHIFMTKNIVLDRQEGNYETTRGKTP